ncbi:SDR family NAD(P)-dependent oxidoreductase [Methylobacterium sp. E-041]|uniref:SDR family NAD(P)-dependent oxidoreductase n=1 Tax=unclassified Methylobacterium TaxID=2615210 RepID=UPI0011CAF02B|nr:MULTISPECIES: SDR family NAD(P)-dependent oxidoreductase [unclassified Methylobacterium]MCJ2038946.1 SDR family NAD(P)-dependent oxidoreductase [Methylobacterium sp. J-059]MCJ2108776.1 SDR family NAD(P)-dependent oxidoreductase [Methylobacterium sp. E-041]TXM89286.1 SDR family NAD(P)-dependent oxidoreductase [Methylobacterium sp. WL116]TXN41484.1 SDR family NAD(P)-dependent oxidoreductase [Methylobacterium sp. WL93]TXN50580.1 SDR family NAD(P)-dependent oxidoreductase [Methylobacterium sp. 
MSARRALIVGASRGLGLGLVARFLERGWAVTATVRRPSAALSELASAGTLRIETGVDIDDDAAVTALRTRLAEAPAFDLVFVVAGVATQAGTPAAAMPRAVATAVFETNALSPIRFAEAFHKRVAPGGLVVLMTSKLGSVSLNRGGGWSSYRASKAALNTLARSFAGQHAKADWGVVLMHPGWVRTDLGGRRATLDVETSARGMVAVLEGRLGGSGCVFLDHAGEVVPW